MAIERRRRADGNYSYRVTWYAKKSGRPVQRSKTFRRRSDAKAFEVEKQAQIARGEEFAEHATTKTIRELTREWVDIKSNTVRTSSMPEYQIARARIDAHFGDAYISNIRTHHLEFFKDHLIKERPLDQARRILVKTKAFFVFARRRGLILSNPAANIEKIRRQPAQDREWPDKAEVRRLLRAETGLFRAFFWLAAFTGLRTQELRALRWSDLVHDQPRNTWYLDVRCAATRDNKIYKLKSKNSRRRVPIGHEVVQILHEWQQKCPSSRLDLVFPNGSGGLLGPSKAGRRFREMQEIIGIVTRYETVRYGRNWVAGKSKYNLHALRHFAASIFIASGIGPKRIQALMGHASITTTFDLYGYLFPDSELTSTSMSAIVGDVMFELEGAECKN
ncbi:tyrosine-type recombinase/integrase [Pelagibacterium sp.]|uniref:tyrosine-type recombinase/integrase n=1 Tax=Pelagibacterium sp. TaxID=1967288 RepID=UPI003A90C74E